MLRHIITPYLGSARAIPVTCVGSSYRGKARGTDIHEQVVGRGRITRVSKGKAQDKVYYYAKCENAEKGWDSE